MNKLFLISNGYSVKQEYYPRMMWIVILPNGEHTPPFDNEVKAWLFADEHYMHSKSKPKVEDLQKIINDLMQENSMLKAELEFTKRHYAYKVGVGSTIELDTEKDPL